MVGGPGGGREPYRRTRAEQVTGGGARPGREAGSIHRLRAWGDRDRGPGDRQRGARPPARGPRRARPRADRAHRPRRRDPLRADRLRRRPARGLDRRAGGGHLPAAPARGRGAVRLQRRAELLEEPPVPAEPDALEGEEGDDGAISFEERSEEVPRYAFIGVRSCDLAAIGVQDRVFIGDGHTDADYEARRREAFVIAVNCGEAGRHVLLRLDGHRAAGAQRLRPGADRVHRRRRAPLPGRGRHRARRGAARGGRRPPGGAGGRRRRAGGLRALRLADGPRAGHRRDQGAALPQHGAPALGRGLRALPHLRQLHPGLPDLLLPHGRGHLPTSPAPRRSAPGSGTPASRSSTPTSTAAASATRRTRATASG